MCSYETPFSNCVLLAGLPKMLVIRNYFGVPSPTSGPALSIQTGDIIELICADLHCPWWQVRVHTLSLTKIDLLYPNLSFPPPTLYG